MAGGGDWIDAGLGGGEHGDLLDAGGDVGDGIDFQHRPVGVHVTVDGIANDGGTDFSYVNEYDLPGGALGRVAGRAVSRVTQKELEGSLQRLKELVE